MSASKKNKCYCELCGIRFRSKDKFTKLCPEHNRKLDENKIKEGVARKEEQRKEQSLERFIRKVGI